MAKPWGRVGAWAEEAERAEAEAKQAAVSIAPVAGGAEAFPSLGEAVSQKSKKKGKVLSLGEFVGERDVTRGYRGKPAASDEKLTFAEQLALPKGPRDRSDEEQTYGGLGGGFKDYGGRNYDGRGAGGFGGDRNRGYDSYRDRGDQEMGRFDRDRGGERGEREPYADRRGAARVSDRDLPSRADEVDDWGAGKKSVGPVYGVDQRRGYDDDYRGGSVSRADVEGNWGAGKNFVPSSLPGRREPGLSERDHWSRREPMMESYDRPRLMMQGRTGSLDSFAGQSLHTDSHPPMPISIESPVSSDTGITEPLPPRRPRPNPFGEARPREEVLAEKGQDWKKLDSDLDAKLSRPSSSHSSRHSSRPQTPDVGLLSPQYQSKVHPVGDGRDSRPSSSHSSRPETPDVPPVVAKPRPKVNPFGDAKPREVLLQERGQDWRKIDLELEHKGVNRPESEEERQLKEEIRRLEDLLKHVDIKGGDANGFASEGRLSLQDELVQKEKELEHLTRDLDDKVRYRQSITLHTGIDGNEQIIQDGRGPEPWASERPQSRSGLSDFRRPVSRSGLSDSGRPPSRSGLSDAGRPQSGGYRNGRAERWTGERPSRRESFDLRRDSGGPDIWRSPVGDGNAQRFGNVFDSDRMRMGRW